MSESPRAAPAGSESANPVSARDWPLWVDGRLRAAGEAWIDARDPGFMLGLCAIEGLRCEGGQPLFVRAHLRRLETSASIVGIAWPPSFDLELAWRAYARALPVTPLYLRTQLTRGLEGAGSVVLGARPLEPLPAEGIRLALAESALEWGIVQRAKHSSRLPLVLAREAARRRGAFDAILRDADGSCSETTVANLFVVRADGSLATPEAGLPGVVRAQVIELALGQGLHVEQGPVRLRDLQAAREIFVTNVAIGILPVCEVLELWRAPSGVASITQGLRAGLRREQVAEMRANGFELDSGTADE